jgi:hypothetical protein
MTGWRTLSTAKTWRGLPPEPVAGEVFERMTEAELIAGLEAAGLIPPHDPDTGELTEPVAAACMFPATEAETGRNPVKLPVPVSALSDQGAGDMPEMPDFLRRAAR